MKANWHTYAGGTGAHHGNAYAWYLPHPWPKTAGFFIEPPQRKHGGYSLKSFAVMPGASWRDHGTFRSPAAAKAAAKAIIGKTV